MPSQVSLRDLVLMHSQIAAPLSTPGTHVASELYLPVPISQFSMCPAVKCPHVPAMLAVLRGLRGWDVSICKGFTYVVEQFADFTGFHFFKTMA